MRRALTNPFSWLAFSAVLLVVILAASAAARTNNAPKPSGSVVKVILKDSHGSATHIGNGLFLTATHVVTDKATVTLKADNGAEGEAEVLWTNKAYDIALLRLPHMKSKELFEFPSASPLVCRDLKDGEQLFARGNPVNLEFISTRGFVAGKARSVGPWRSVNPMDISIAGGMSGGGVFDANGNLVAVTVGIMAMPMGFSGTAVGISYVVPSAAFCTLLARA